MVVSSFRKIWLLPQHTAIMYLLCLYLIEVWSIPRHLPQLQTWCTHSARLNMELMWESLRGTIRRMPGHGVCGGALGWQWSLGPWADGLQEAYWQEKRSEGRKGRERSDRFAAKRKTCLVALPPKKQSHNTPVQVAAEGNRVCRLGLYVGSLSDKFNS